MRSRGFKASKVCVAFASELQRSHETCELALASMAGHEQHTWSSERIRRDWRLNERHYGIVQGKYKDDPELKTQELFVVMNKEGGVEKIDIVSQTETALAGNKSWMTYEPASGYLIKTQQKNRTAETLHIEIKGTFVGL